MTRKRELETLTKRVEEARRLLNIRIDNVEFLLNNGRLRRSERRLYEAERDVLVAVDRALQGEQSHPRAGRVRALAQTALAAITIAVVSPVGTGALEEIGADGVQQLQESLVRLVDSSDDAAKHDRSDREDPDDDPDLVSDEELLDAWAVLHEHYVPASRDVIPWDSEDGEWMAPTEDIWVAVADALEDFPERVRRAVIDHALMNEGPEWVSQEYLNRYGE